MSAPAIEKEAPQPLRKKRSEAAAFPIEACPPMIRNAILGLHDKIQAPIAICAQSVLAAANLAVQGHADIELPFGQVRPLSCLFLTIAESGERKTSCDNEVEKFIAEYEAELRANHKTEHRIWQNSFDAWDKQRAQILSNQKKFSDKQSKALALNDLGTQPIAPLNPMLTCAEPTFEGLCKLMAVGQPSMGIFSSEGGQFLYGHSMKDENKLKTAAALSDLWDGKSIKRIRSGDGNMMLCGRRLCVHLMIQPNIAAKFLSDPQLQGQGLLSRMLAVSPISTIGTRFSRAVSESSNEAIAEFGKALLSIFRKPHITKDDCLNELTPRIIKCDIEASALLSSFADSIESRISSNGELESIRALASKLPEHAARLATTLALFDNIETTTISSEYIKYGIRLAEFYGEEALRFAADGITDPNILLAEKLLKWLRNAWTEDLVSLPDIYQNLNAISNRDTAQRIVSILESHGYLEKLPTSSVVKGKTRQHAWKIIKEEAR